MTIQKAEAQIKFPKRQRHQVKIRYALLNRENKSEHRIIVKGVEETDDYEELLSEKIQEIISGKIRMKFSAIDIDHKTPCFGA